MPAKSKAQQSFFGIVHALQAGALNPNTLPKRIRSKIERVASSMSSRKVDDFAKTKRSKLPAHVKESATDAPWNDIDVRSMSLIDYIVASSIITEEWDEEYVVPANKRGMFDGKDVEQLERELATLKKSGPHAKGSPEYTREKELMFAIRAKHDWKSGV